MQKPKIVKAVYDDGGKTFDRYTVVIDEKEGPGMNTCLALSSNPTSP